MICPKCGGSGKIFCSMCKGTGLYHDDDLMTEQEYIQTCNTEQLAEVLMKIFMTRTFCHICPEGGVCDIGYKCKYHGGNTKDFVAWLKQPHTK